MKTLFLVLKTEITEKQFQKYVKGHRRVIKPPADGVCLQVFDRDMYLAGGGVLEEQPEIVRAVMEQFLKGVEKDV